ncbi:MAG: DEAD/DEAH box helicase, partial [Clostridiales Family XIII bacterium]|nr:DEAD/DEAH box helicase [Clostridiales Family XIII bacterium]
KRVGVTFFDGRDLTAQVDGKKQGGYGVALSFGDEKCSAISAARCSCPDFSIYSKYCRHIIAAALEAQRMASKGELVDAEEPAAGNADAGRPAEDADDGYAEDDWDDAWLGEGEIGERDIDEEPARTSERKTDEYAVSMLMNASILRANRLSAAANTHTEERLALEPVLHVSRYDGYYLTLRLGAKKRYILKDLSEFIAAYTYAEKMSFGKDTEVVPTRGAFEPESLPLLDFALRHYRYPNESNELLKRRIRFTNTVVDEFFALFSDEDILKIEGKGNIRPGDYRIREKDCPVHFKLTRKDGGASLTQESDVDIIMGRSCAYLAEDGVLYKCSPAYGEKCKYFLQSMARQGGAAFIAEEDLPTLFTAIIQETEDFLRFDIDEALLMKQPEPLSTKIYFDINEKDAVTARMTFSYGEQTHEAFAEKYLSKTIDLAGERNAEQLLMQYMGRALTAPGTLILQEDENALYELVAHGMGALSEIAEIYASDAFETLKIREKVGINVGVRLDGHLLEIDFDLESIDFRELADILKSYRKAKKFRRMKDGSFLSLEGGAIAELAEFTDGLDISERELAQGKIQLDMNRAPYVDAMLKQSDEIRYERDDAFKTIIRNLRDIADADYQPSPGLAKLLRNYQKTGFRWLKTIDALHFGGILADDMGLGKTVQVLALLQSEKEDGREDGRANMGGLTKYGAEFIGGTLTEGSGTVSYMEGGEARRPSIVVCPASVVLNWEAEAARFTPGLKTIALTGGKEERERVAKRARAYDLVITSYGQLVRDVALYKNIVFRYVILDEAQFIKNQNTQNARAVKQLSGRSRFALTGTPVENSLAELWSIFDFVMPGYLYNYGHFHKKFETQIVKYGDERSTERLRELVRPFILRRLKKDVLKELPEKTESVIVSAMEEEQRKLYLATLAQVKSEMAQKMEEATENQNQNRMEIFAALMRLRQICCDPSLIFENFTGRSAKLDTCLELVKNCIESRHRMLLFSQFTSMMDILRREFEKEGIAYFYLDGSTPKKDRLSLVNDFHAGNTPVFLISLRAGGTGINLTGADVIIHYDPWWNVSVQNQATDRAHRIGQTQHVQVFKLIAQDSIEEKILHLQESKAALAENIIKAGGNAFETLSQKELMSLFEVDG